MAKVYHQTGETAAIAILKSQNMLRGSNGLVGGGIYFASAPPQTRGKAHDTGVMLKCTVQLGNPKNVDATKYRNTNVSWPKFTHSSLKNDGFDSVMITGLDTGVEFVVYNSSQVRTIEWQGGTDVRHQVNLEKAARDKAAKEKWKQVLLFPLFLVGMTFSCCLCRRQKKKPQSSTLLPRYYIKGTAS